MKPHWQAERRLFATKNMNENNTKRIHGGKHEPHLRRFEIMFVIKFIFAHEALPD